MMGDGRNSRDDRASTDYSEIDELFQRLAKARDDGERRKWRCRIIDYALPLADHIAYRFVGRGEPGEDLVQVARLGLIKAVDRYEEGKGRFVAFAVLTVLGDVRRYFRDNTWGMQVPRRIKETHRRMRAAIDPLSQRLGRAPTASELAAELGVSREDVAEAVEAAYAYRPTSLDRPTPGGAHDETPRLRDHGAEDPRYGRVEDVLTVAELVSRLPDREQDILRMRFCDCLPQTQIAQRLGVSQVHVSRILSKTLQRLRNHFWDDEKAVTGAFA